ncbi:MAG: MFS transporter [Sporomusaceae bacterium]|nr:MFS transporter [Sporomusaceae bacterium]
METIQKKATGKYFVFILLYLGWCISYIDRAAINISLAAIGKEFLMSPSTMGIVLSSFFVGYALMQLPGGWLADKFGSKKIIIAGILFWSIFTGITGFAWSFASLIAIRFLFGIGEGAFPPASLKGIAENFSKEDRPKMTSALLSSNYIGSAIAPMVIAPLLMFLGWRHMFGVIGALGVIFIIVYWFGVRETRPSEAGETKAKVQKVPMKELLKMPLMWKLVIAWFGLSLVNKGLDSWMPTYLLTVRHLDLKAIGLLTPLPFIAAGISTAIGGWLMVRFFDKKEKYFLIGSASMTAVFLYFMYTAQTVGMVIFFQSIVYFFKSFVMAICMSLPMKLLPGTVSGSAAGMINLGGQSAGFVSPVIIGFMISAFNGSYDAAFFFLIGAACLTIISALTIRTDKVVAVTVTEDGKLVRSSS